MGKIARDKEKPRICFVAHDAYGAMTGGHQGHIGGVERQTSLMARWFAEHGYDVAMLTWDEGGPAEETVDGVRLIKLCRRDAGIKGLRFFWPKWSSLLSALKRADADVYYQNCAECVTGQVALWCRRHGRRFVFSAACDPQCDIRLPYLRTRHERVLYRYGVKAADKVIVQSQKQWEMMRQGFQRDSVVLSMPCPGPAEVSLVDREAGYGGSPRVLWIARVCEQKRPDRLLDLAEACPDLTFDLVGPADDTEYARRICQRARTTSNVVVHGPASREEVSDFYRKAVVMCSTSDVEGFPNTFLEAWSYGLPIVTIFDPDNVVARQGLGVVAQDVRGLAAGIRSLCEAPDRRGEISRKARQYYLEHFTVDAAMAKFEEVFTGLCRESERRAG